MRRLRAAALLLLLPVAAVAQTANGSPTAPASPGLIGTPRPVSRTAPSVGMPKRGEEAAAGFKAPAKQPPVHKETKAERAERLKLEHDLNICIGC